MGIDIGVLSAKVSLDTGNFNAGVNKVTSGFDKLGQRAMHLNQGLELIQKGFRMAESAVNNVIAPIYKTNLEIARLKKSFEEITGSTEGAASEMQFLHDVADRLGQNFYDLADSYKGILAASKGTRIEGEGTRKVFEAVTKATASLGISSEGTKGALNAISQMMSKGKITAEELRQQLGERLYGAFGLMAQAAGVSTRKLDDMLQQGKVNVELLEKFADVLNGKYTGAIDEGTRAVNKFDEAWIDMKKVMGDSGFMTSITNALKSLTEALKDPDTQRALADMAKNLGIVVEQMAKLAKYAGLRSISNTNAQAAKLAQEGVLKLTEYFKLSFVERQRLVDDILAKQKQIEEGAQKAEETALRIAAQSSTVKPPVSSSNTPAHSDDGPELEKEQLDALKAVNDLIADARHKMATASMDGMRQSIADAHHEAAKLRYDLGDMLNTTPGLADAVDQFEKISVAAASAANNFAITEEIKALKRELDALNFEASITGLDQFSAALMAADYQAKALKEQLKDQGLANSKTLGLVDQINAQSKQNIMDQIAQQTRDQMAQEYQQKSDNGIALLMGQQEDFASQMFGGGNGSLETYHNGLVDIEQQYQKMIQSGAVLKEHADIWRENAQGMLEYQTIANTLGEAFSALTGPLSDALTELAQTGKTSIKDMVNGMLKELQAFAAQKTANLLMTAAYEGVMALVAWASKDTQAMAAHQAAAVAAAQGAAVMGSFVAGSALAGMAHSGISNIPEDGTWLLKKNERVVDSETNADLKEFLKGNGGSSVVIEQININNSDEQGVRNALPELKQMILETVNQDISTNGDTIKNIRQFK